MKSFMVGLLLLGVPLSAAAQGAKYGVASRADKNTDFTKLKTYTWTTGWSAFNRSIDRRIVAAIDRELAKLGFVELESQPADVLVTYAGVPRTDVDVKSKGTGSSPRVHREYPAGTLVVRLLEPRSQRELYWAKIDAPLASDSATVQKQIDLLVPTMFRKYPTRRAERR